MELEKINDAWCGCGMFVWRELDNEQHGKIIKWFKDNLGVKDCPDDSYVAMLAYMSCPDPVEMMPYRIDKIKCDEKPRHVGFDLRVYPDAETRDEANEKFMKRFSFHVPLLGDTGKNDEEGRKNAQALAEKHAFDGYDGHLYRVVDMDGDVVRVFGGSEEVFANRRNAEEKLRKLLAFTAHTSAPKKKILEGLIKRGGPDFRRTKAGGRIMSDKQDDEFRKFLETV